MSDVKNNYCSWACVLSPLNTTDLNYRHNTLQLYIFSQFKFSRLLNHSSTTKDESEEKVCSCESADDLLMTSLAGVGVDGKVTTQI